MAYRNTDKEGRVRRLIRGGNYGPPFYGYLHPVLPPNIGSFTWINQGGATATELASKAQFLSAPNSGVVNLRILKKTSPLDSWYAQAGFLPLLYNEVSHRCGILFRESSTGKVHALCYENDGNIAIRRYTSPTVFASEDLDVAFPANYGPVFLKIADDGASFLNFSIGTDAENWLIIGQLARNAHFTTAPDEMGVFVASETSNFNAAAAWFHWRQGSGT